MSSTSSGGSRTEPGGRGQADASEPILRAAEALVRERGAAFTMEQLERRTGVSRATLYRRIGGKGALLRRLGERGLPVAGAGADAPARIVAAARRVVAGRGVAGATMERVAEEAGVGVATVYRHFGGREQLLHAFLKAAEARARTRERIDRANGELREDLTAIARDALALFGDNRDLMRVVLGGRQQELELLSALKGSSERTLHRLASLFQREASAGRLEPETDPRRLALGFIGMLLAYAVVGPEHYGIEATDPDALAVLAVHLFLDGAAV